MPADVETEILLRWGAAIRARRKSNGLSQEDLADGAEVDQRTISAYENGRFPPPLETRIKIARTLATTHDSLFSVDQVVA